MSFTVIIPARYASSRLPGKPLVDIGGKPMIEHVYRRACQSEAERIIVATDDTRIADVVSRFGAEVCMTSAECESGTDRLQQVVSALNFIDEQIVVNVQGDEPLIPPAVINQVAADLAANSAAQISTLIKPIDDVETLFDPNAVKVARALDGRALYFSRAPIPWHRDGWLEQGSRTMPAGASYYRHIGIYAYRVALLQQFVLWPPSALELTEKLEQLRALENGATISTSLASEEIPPGIDTQHDLELVRALLQ
ncbi:MAG: 3-deoxy-manno-octulosonate cytidylyltransferase (CMP-KDO synthetase) [Paraglaciecola psychrophila]|jgi:3-deoxy-manno-octulosonate cytidylyltransferase (CMP-KDO synthetase)